MTQSLSDALVKSGVADKLKPQPELMSACDGVLLTVIGSQSCLLRRKRESEIRWCHRGPSVSSDRPTFPSLNRDSVPDRFTVE